MVNFGLRTAKEAREEAKKWESLRKDIDALGRVAAALDVYEVLAKHPEVTEWGVRVEKSYYNDDGLYEGAYADYVTAKKPEMCPEGDEYEYPDEDDLTPIHQALNAALTKYQQENAAEGQSVFPSGVYPNGLKGLEKFLRDFAGKEYAAQWKAGVEAEQIGASAEKPKKSKKADAAGKGL